MRGDKLKAKILRLPGVYEVWDEGQDGWWISTKFGWRQSDNTCHCWSGPTLTALLQDAKGLVRCSPGCSCGYKEVSHGS